MHLVWPGLYRIVTLSRGARQLSTGELGILATLVEDRALPRTRNPASEKPEIIRQGVNSAMERTVERRAKVTRVVLEHVERADDAVKNFCDDAVNSEGILTHPGLQAAALKVAREELRKAIALIERTKWISERK
jgi:hypothetical protein